MRRSSTLALALAFVVATSLAARACGAYGVDAVPMSLEAAWRAAGPDGLTAALAACDAAETEEQRAALAAIVDRVAGQRGATVSRLYWYADLGAAQDAAAASGKPILSLRMLGKLTDEYSCANSRFFRTALYSNREISDYLRDNYVLHWQSVRPVPRITIDFGDGRKLDRTVTGNSAHYVLDADGRPVDALPGLYGPQAFREWLQRSAELVAALSGALDRGAALAEYHARQGMSLDRQFQREVASIGEFAAAPDAPRATNAAAAPSPNAVEVMPLALSKAAVETPLAAFALGERPAENLADDAWQAIAARHAGEAVLDEASREVMRGEMPDALAAGRLAGSKRMVEDPLVRIVAKFENSIALDTVKNEYLLHRQIHAWFAAGEVPAEVDALNERVYAELFLTPSSDPWLGLAPADAYTALDGGGLTFAE